MQHNNQTSQITILLQQGIAELASQQTQNAITTFTQALALSPENPDIYAYLGQAYLQNKQFIEAEKNLNKALSFTPQHPSANACMGELWVQKQDINKAASYFQQALKADPNNVTANRWLGFILKAAGQFTPAIQYLENTLVISPQDVEALFALAACYAVMGREEQAIASYQKAVALQPDNAQLHMFLAERLAANALYSDALSHYDKAISLQPESPVAYAMKLSLLMDMNEWEQAKTVLNTLPETVKQTPELLYPRALLVKKQGDLQQASMLLKQALSYPLDMEKKASIQHDLATILEKLQAYDDAFSMYQASMQSFSYTPQAKQQRPDIFRQLVHILRTWEGITSIVIKKEALPPVGVTPIFLVGFPRSGTTLAEQVLASHPDLIATEEEPVIEEIIVKMGELLGGRTIRYPQAIAELTPEDLTILRGYYTKRMQTLFGEKLQHQRIVDKMPLNLVHLPLIYRMFPNAPVIMMIRDPRDVVLSCFTQLFTANGPMMNFLTLEGAAQFYASIMELYFHYKATLPLSIHEIRYEDMVSNIEPYAKEILHAAEVPWDETVLGYYKHNRYVKTPSAEGVLQPTYTSSIGRWKHFERYIIPVLPILQSYTEKLKYEV